MSNEYKKHNKKPIHRIVMEKKLGRELNLFEIVHHIDRNKHNNSPRNLKLMTREEHTSLHSAGKRKYGKQKVKVIEEHLIG